LRNVVEQFRGGKKMKSKLRILFEIHKRNSFNLSERYKVIKGTQLVFVK